ncbi:MAG: arginine repressor [Desulfobacteraceae bacterium]|nr:arginine repressor [Desulfobacteraceae bacterium]
MRKFNKKQRWDLIRKIIHEKEISDQIQLLEALSHEGLKTTQATISRDLQELKVVKARIKPGIYKYSIFESTIYSNLIHQLGVFFYNFVNEIKGAGNQIVIKNIPGTAGTVAMLLDQMERNEILGTIAGLDTILVIVDSEENRIKLQKEFNDILTREP